MGRRARGMPFTEEQMQKIYNTNLINFAVEHGFEIEKGDRNTVHVKHSGGLYLFKHGRGYTCFSKPDSKGNIVDFVREYMGAVDFKSAAEIILNCRAYESNEYNIPPVEKKPRGDLVLPPKDECFDRTIAYLTHTRGIDAEIVNAMIDQGRVYGARTEKSGYRFQNCAFVGYDERGTPRYCALRSPNADSHFRQDVENSDKTCGFTMEGHSNRVYEFEAPIDAMSHATLCKLHGIDWRKDHRVSEGCLSDKALHRYLRFHPEITEIVFCYDNDLEGKLADGTPHNHGQIQAKKSVGTYTNLGYKCFIQTPKTKDFNQDLLTYRAILQADEHEPGKEAER